MADICQSLIDQLTEKQLFDAYEPTVHCTGAYTDELPQDKEKNVRPGDVWTFGLAQMLGSVSPQMFEEYEVEYVKPLLEQFGLVYYGCWEQSISTATMSSPASRTRPIWRLLPLTRSLCAGNCRRPAARQRRTDVPAS